MFEVGQKVVCIQDLSPACGQGEIAPVKGQVYTVRSIASFPNMFAVGTVLGIRLVEIVNETKIYWIGRREAAFDAFAFRPVIERKNEAGMSILTDILVKTKVKEPA